MPESMLLALLAGGLLGVGVVVVFLIAQRYGRGSRELGTDAERATYETLHLASRAAAHLREGLSAADAARAGKHLRALLGCEALAIAGRDDVLAVDGREGLAGVAQRLARQAQETGRAQLQRAVAGSGREALDAIAHPVCRDGHSAGAIVAFAAPVRAGLVRATSEVADWVGAQLALGELDASRAALAEAQLRALRAQISPHFIYNALGAIASSIRTNPEQARELVLEFADFTRYSFRRQGDFTTLAEELRSIDSYLRLERARFGDRLQVTLRIAPEVLPTILPFLAVQPLVENAVRHGLEAKEGGGRIAITAHDQGAYAEITVEDDGVGIDPDTARRVLAGDAATEHIGLRNVDARLRRLYGEEHGLVVETNLGAGTLVRMRVPKSAPGLDREQGAPARVGTVFEGRNP